MTYVYSVPSQNSEEQGPVVNNSAVNKKKSNSNALVMDKQYTLKQIRELVFMIRTKSKGKLSLQEISRQCGWDKSRLNQILRNFTEYFPKKQKYQDIIWKKLQDCLESIERETKKDGGKDVGTGTD